jgi:N utilization substance protein A
VAYLFDFPAHPNFVRALFSLEAPEISNGTVEIKEIAREAGSRTKLAVYSQDEHIDPVGSCVGQRGVRVATVISELGGEKIDVIEWSPEIQKFIADALSPAKVRSVVVNDEEKYAEVEVQADQLSLAIGRGGQNVRLAVKLTGYRIDIKSPEGVQPEISAEDAGIQEVQEFIESDSEVTINEGVSTEDERTDDLERMNDPRVDEDKQ